MCLIVSSGVKGEDWVSLNKVYYKEENKDSYAECSKDYYKEEEKADDN